MAGIGVRLAVFMTADAGEQCIVRRLVVAVGTARPDPVVPARVNREELGVVLRVLCRGPAGIGRMAISAVK